MAILVWKDEKGEEKRVELKEGYTYVMELRKIPEGKFKLYLLNKTTGEEFFMREFPYNPFLEPREGEFIAIRKRSTSIVLTTEYKEQFYEPRILVLNRRYRQLALELLADDPGMKLPIEIDWEYLKLYGGDVDINIYAGKANYRNLIAKILIDVGELYEEKD